MNMEMSAEECVSILRADTSFGHDVAGDYVLPDYMPEIKKLLYVSSSVLPESKFLNGGALELDGAIAYNVVYVGDDGTLSAAPLVTEYSADTAIASFPNGAEGIFADTQLESTTCRATGPRSLNIKSRLKFHIICDETYEDEGTVTDGDGNVADPSTYDVERRSDEVASVVRRRGSVTESVSGKITAPDGAKPLICDGTLTVNSAAPSGDAVKASGSVCVRCVFSKDGEYMSEECDIPFETSVPINSASPFTDGRAWGRVASVSVAPSETDAGTFTVGAEYDLDAEAYCKTSSAMCTDAYSTDHTSENEYRECEIPEMILFGTKRAEVSGETELKGGGDVASVLSVSPAVCQAAVSVSDGKISAVGSVKVRVLLNAGGEIFAQEVEMPLRVELADAPEGVTPQEIQSALTCSECGTLAKASDGKLYAESRVMLTYSVCRIRKVKCVTAVKLGERRDADGVPCIKVYYPERDESVWSVCKKYRADTSKVLKNNSFEGGVAPKGKPVIIT